MNLTGKWKYFENYGEGVAEGELYLRQEGSRLFGRIVFLDRLKGEEAYMVQEFLTGSVEERKVSLDATEFDVIDSDNSVSYKLDSWFGILVEDAFIKGASVDAQGVTGNFEFVKVDDRVSDNL